MKYKLNFSQNSIYTIILILIFGIGSQITIKAQRPIDYVDPFIGSGGHGHVFVGASVPFGAVQVGPNNIFKGWDWCSGYNYADSLIIGFSQLHLSGTGIGDLGDVLLMPFTGAVRLDKGRQEYPHNSYLSTFSHKNETTRPGYYSVKMDNGVAVELTATERVAFHQYQFPKGKDAHVIIDLKEGINDRSTDTYLELVDDYTLKGHRFSSGWAKKQQVFFAVRSSQPIKNLAIYDGDKLISGEKGQGKSIKGVLNFEQGAFVLFKVGISPVSADNALENIEAEIPEWNFKAVANSAANKWEQELSVIAIQTKNTADKRIFYTALFHALVHPSLFNDYNGDYRGADDKIYTNPGFNNYSVFSTWDTYRAEHPLFTMICPSRVGDFVNPCWRFSTSRALCPSGTSTDTKPERWWASAANKLLLKLT